MRDALQRVSRTKAAYDTAVIAARHLQARLVVDALYGRYRYQVKRKRTDASFGEWLVQKRSLQATYASLSAEVVLWLYAGIVHEAMNDRRYRLFANQDVSEDWLTPLIETFIGRRVEEQYFVVRVTSWTVPFSGQKEALPSLSFIRKSVPSRLDNP